MRGINEEGATSPTEATPKKLVVQKLTKTDVVKFARYIPTLDKRNCTETYNNFVIKKMTIL